MSALRLCQRQGQEQGQAGDRTDRLRHRHGRLEGAEHRLYSEAGKYTGIFWPVNRRSRRADYTLQLMSLAKITNVALHAELKNLPAPQSGNRCPIEDVPHSKAGR